jgi:hypothetical protein
VDCASVVEPMIQMYILALINVETRGRQAFKFKYGIKSIPLGKLFQRITFPPSLES